MSTVRGVRVIDPEGRERIYNQGRDITRDGYGDYEIRDARGAIIATRRRETVAEIENLYE